MKPSRLLSLTLVAALIVGCSNPTETAIPPTGDLDSIASDLKKLEPEEKRLFTGYFVRAKMGEAFGGDGIRAGFTVGDAIAAQRSWELKQAQQEAEAAALKAKLTREKAALEAEISQAVVVTLLSKKEVPADYSAGRISAEQSFSVGVLNKSGKPIVGVAGQLTFIDVFDKEVGAVGFGISERIEPGESYTWTGSREYNEFMDHHRAVWNLEDGKYTTKFEPEAIVFADGTKLKIPE